MREIDLNNTMISSKCIRHGGKRLNDLLKNFDNVNYNFDNVEFETNEYFLGKKIYRRCLASINVNANYTYSTRLQFDYSNIWIDQENSFNQYAGATSYSGLSWWNSNSDTGFVYIQEDKDLVIKNNSGSNRTYYIVLKYTK